MLLSKQQIAGRYASSWSTSSVLVGRGNGRVALLILSTLSCRSLIDICSLIRCKSQALNVSYGVLDLGVRAKDR